MRTEDTVFATLCGRRTRRERPPGAADAGFTLLEVVVSMTLMSIFLAIFGTGMVQLYRASTATEQTAIAQSQGSAAISRLDLQIRYASAISTQGTVNGDPYVEYLTTNTGSAVCTELRLHTVDNTLQQRSWTEVKAAAATVPTAWTQLATGVSAAQPFQFRPPDGTSGFQRLNIRFTARYGAATAARSRTTDVTFTALNTSRSTASSTVCAEGRTMP